MFHESLQLNMSLVFSSGQHVPEYILVLLQINGGMEDKSVDFPFTSIVKNTIKWDKDQYIV